MLLSVQASCATRSPGCVIAASSRLASAVAPSTSQYQRSGEPRNRSSSSSGASRNALSRRAVRSVRPPLVALSAGLAIAQSFHQRRVQVLVAAELVGVACGAVADCLGPGLPAPAGSDQ